MRREEVARSKKQSWSYKVHAVSALYLLPGYSRLATCRPRLRLVAEYPSCTRSSAGTMLTPLECSWHGECVSQMRVGTWTPHCAAHTGVVVVNIHRSGSNLVIMCAQHCPFVGEARHTTVGAQCAKEVPKLPQSSSAPSTDLLHRTRMHRLSRARRPPPRTRDFAAACGRPSDSLTHSLRPLARVAIRSVHPRSPLPSLWRSWSILNTPARDA